MVNTKCSELDCQKTWLKHELVIGYLLVSFWRTSLACWLVEFSLNYVMSQFRLSGMKTLLARRAEPTAWVLYMSVNNMSSDPTRTQ